MQIDYRKRLYEKYASKSEDSLKEQTLAEVDRWTRPYKKYLKGWLPEDKQAVILDIGCGRGRLLRFLSEQGYTHVTGLDVSPEQVRRAQKLHPDVIQADALEYLNENKGRFDCIIAIDIIEHFRKDEVMGFLDVCHQALRPEGRLIIQTPNANSPWGLPVRYGDFTHEICFSPKSLSWLLRECGFVQIRMRELGPVPCGVLSSVRCVAWKFVRLVLAMYDMIETGSYGSGIFTRVFIASGIRS